jgi:uncharacterized protein with GYD domain
MPLYITFVKWTEQGVQNIRETVNRVDQASAAAEKAGGRLVDVWWTQGEYDIVGVWDLPDDETASALILSVALAGNVRSQTVRAFDRAAMQRIIQKLP